MREFLFYAVLLLLILTSAGALASDSPPVLVELFTSQGCSSCPSAEEVLSTWGMNAFQKKQIIPLAFHVDSWDALGWKDPFSSIDATARQENYAASFKSASIYTPQMVIAGQTAFVGSDRKRAEETLAHFAGAGSGVRLQVNPSWKNGILDFSITAETGTEAAKDASYLVMAAVFENNLVTKILRGENAGRTLHNDFVVRTFAQAGVFKTGNQKKFSKTVRLSWPPEWKRENSGLVIFLQNQETLETEANFCAFPLAEKPLP